MDAKAFTRDVERFANDVMRSRTEAIIQTLESSAKEMAGTDGADAIRVAALVIRETYLNLEIKAD